MITLLGFICKFVGHKAVAIDEANRAQGKMCVRCGVFFGGQKGKDSDFTYGD